MAVGLYGHEPLFTEAMDTFFAALGAEGKALRADWLSERPTIAMADIRRSQPLLFAVDHALGALVLDRGPTPSALVGHSIGEMAAATLAGVFDLAEAARLVWDRVCRLLDAPPGGMLAVGAAAAELDGYLTHDVVIAALNSPRQTMLAGPTEPLRAVAERLRADGLTCRPVPSTAAFHSPLLADVAAGARPVFANARTRAPRLPVFSSYTCRLLGPAEAGDPGFWASHPVAPVLFWPTLARVLDMLPNALIVHAGPGAGVASLARRHPAVRRGTARVVAMLPERAGDPAADRQATHAALAHLNSSARHEQAR
jgi:acyl transferase domain-containing protein